MSPVVGSTTDCDVKVPSTRYCTCVRKFCTPNAVASAAWSATLVIVTSVDSGACAGNASSAALGRTIDCVVKVHSPAIDLRGMPSAASCCTSGCCASAQRLELLRLGVAQRRHRRVAAVEERIGTGCEPHRRRRQQRLAAGVGRRRW